MMFSKNGARVNQTQINLALKMSGLLMSLKEEVGERNQRLSLNLSNGEPRSQKFNHNLTLGDKPKQKLMLSPIKMKQLKAGETMPKFLTSMNPCLSTKNQEESWLTSSNKQSKK